MENTKQLRRWFLTINNPFWTDNDIEVDLATNTLPILTNHYNLETIKDETNINLFHFKHIQITINNEPVIVERPYFKDMASVQKYIEGLEHFKYSVFQLEQGEQETPHIQAGIIFEAGKRFVTIKKYFPTAYIDRARGSNTDLRAYCMKQEGRIGEPIEIGKFSEMRSRTDIVEFFDNMDKGASNQQLKRLFPTLYSQYGVEKIEKFRQDDFKEKYGNEFRDIKVTYIYGATRLGKTSHIYTLHPIKDICRVTNYKVGTFENYVNQSVLVLDEFTGKLDIGFVNNLLDKYPLDLPSRFTNRTACFTQVYIISNLSLDQLYKEEQEKHPAIFQAFKARLTEIIKFTALGKYTYEKQAHEPQQVQFENGMRIITDEEAKDMPF